MISRSSPARLQHPPPGLIAVILSAAALGLIVYLFMNSSSERTAFLQPVSLVPPALPPQQPPPPEKQEIDKELPQHASSLDTNDLSVGVTGAGPGPANDTGPSSGVPATGPLGINEVGEGGSDAFGLAARSGGRELLYTRSGGGGNPGPRYAEFTNQLQSHIKAQLNQYAELRQSCYSVRAEIRVGAGGFIQAAKINSSSGDAALDSQLRAVLLNLAPMDAAPPADMPQPVGLKIVSRRGDCGP